MFHAHASEITMTATAAAIAPRRPYSRTFDERRERVLAEAALESHLSTTDARLANELLEANEGRGGAMKRRDEVHRMAEANKAFSHFRF